MTAAKQGCRAPNSHVRLTESNSANFGFLARHDGASVAVAAQAERYFAVSDASRQGLEFKTVAVMACDDVLPLQFRIEAITDEV